MSKSDKRARKKEFRDAARAEYEARLRRRRNVRLVGTLLVLAVIAALALGGPAALFGEDEEEQPRTEVGGEPTDQAEDPDAAACGAEVPPEAEPKEYDSPPKMTLEKGTDYGAIINTSCGTIEIDLLEDETPITVNNFIFLAKEGYYDGLIWHRVEQNSVIQTGDPNGQNGTPPDGPGYAIEDELPEKASQYVYGVVGMANSGPNSGGGQWFIVIHKNRPAGYQPFYAIFGEVTGGTFDGDEEAIGCTPSDAQGEDVVETLEIIGCQPTQGGEDPVEAVKPKVPVYIESIEITEG